MRAPSTVNANHPPANPGRVSSSVAMAALGPGGGNGADGGSAEDGGEDGGSRRHLGGRPDRAPRSEPEASSRRTLQRVDGPVDAARPPLPPRRSRALSSRLVFGTGLAGRGGRLASRSFRTRAASDETISGRAPAGGRAPSLSGEGGGPGTGSRRKRRAMKRRRPSTAVDGGADDDNRCCSIAIAIVLLIILLSPILKSQSSFRAPGPPFDDVPPLLSFAADPPFIICHPSLLPLLFRRIRLRARAALCLASFALPAANRLDV